MTTEQRIKSQFSKIFKPHDSIPFKQIADYYFTITATLKKKDIDAPEGLKLWFRNVQKRLYIGIASELLLKAIFLKNNFNINKAKIKKIRFPEKINRLNELDLNPSETYSLAQMIDKIGEVISLGSENKDILEGLNICKVFRNKEGHVAVYLHDFEKEDFKKIEFSIRKLYKIGFLEDLEYKISMTEEQGTGMFKKK